MATRIQDSDTRYSPLDGCRLVDATSRSVDAAAPPKVFRSTTLRTKVTPVEKRRFLRLATRLGEALDASVSPSHLLRPLMELAVQAENQLLDAAGRSGPVYRPPNDRRAELDRFEEDIRQMLMQAIVSRELK